MPKALAIKNPEIQRDALHALKFAEQLHVVRTPDGYVRPSKKVKD